MSQVELHLIRQRMASGRLAKAGRGELAVPLPAGYARRASGEVALDPDEQVQAVIRLVFRPVRAAGHGACGAAVPGRASGPDRDAGAVRAGQGRSRLAGAASAGPGEHAAQPGLCGDLRLRAQPHRPVPAAARARALRPGARAGGRGMAGPHRGRAAGLYQRGAVRAEPGAAGRQPGPRGEPGRAAGGPRAAGRAGGLRDLRSPPAGELRDQRAGADRPVLLPAPPSHLRRAALPADGRAVPR